MILNSRTVTITLGLILAGAVAGAAAGLFAIEVAVLVYLRSFAPLPIAGVSSAIGVVCGGIVAPVLACSVLRRVPLGRAIAGIAVGSGIGGAVGILVGHPL